MTDSEITQIECNNILNKLGRRLLNSSSGQSVQSSIKTASISKCNNDTDEEESGFDVELESGQAQNNQSNRIILSDLEENKYDCDTEKEKMFNSDKEEENIDKEENTEYNSNEIEDEENEEVSYFSLNVLMNDQFEFCQGANELAFKEYESDFYDDSNSSQTINGLPHEVNQSANPNDSQYSDSPELDSKPPSVVFFLTPEKKIYKLTFEPINAYFRPLYLHPRDIDISTNNKKTQPYSDARYRDGKPLKSRTEITMLNNLVKSFSTDVSRDSVCILEKLALRKKDITYPKYKPIKKIKPNPISRINRDPMESVIYIEHKEITFAIKTGLLMINRIRPQHPELPEFTRIKNKLSLLGMKDRINKGQFLVRYKNDVLLFKFDMKNVTFGKHKSHVSLGTQAQTNKHIYLPSISMINDRRVMVAVPKTLYEYTDINFKIQNYNKHMWFSNRIPDWQDELRRKRMSQRDVKPHEEEIERISKIKSNGSVLLFEGLNCEIRSVAGLVTSLISKGKKTYENYVKAEQKSRLLASIVRKDDDEFGKSVDKQYDYIVADHELIDQTK